MELISNCDIVVAWEGAKFALPEVSRGVMASQGGIPRLAAAAGHQVGPGYNVYQPRLSYSLSFSSLPNSYSPEILSQPEKHMNVSTCEYRFIISLALVFNDTSVV
jgi:hypothetical protein